MFVILKHNLLRLNLDALKEYYMYMIDTFLKYIGTYHN